MKGEVDVEGRWVKSQERGDKSPTSSLSCPSHLALSAPLYTLVVVLQATRRGNQDALILPWHGASSKFTDREKADLMAGLGTRARHPAVSFASLALKVPSKIEPRTKGEA